ncbi:MAG: hypothetical protein K6T33_10650 [Thermomonas hydrothermalis]|uniref:hypothetical protein n=1 Tax=Thermomonas hydrothermalis TaxID=213588 RepID=UPI002353C6B7|nr:hypothetical protein [Thermomonas hydrothermalis]MCL6620231.1 hypothetical protein [Thermomonas hydrothermalis]
MAKTTPNTTPEMPPADPMPETGGRWYRLPDGRLQPEGAPAPDIEIAADAPPLPDAQEA